MLKEMVTDEQSGKIPPLIYSQKEEIVTVLIQITTHGYRNPQEQYKQAYSLKALMWLKEEFIGLQETFQLTHKIMNAYAVARYNNRDFSIEEYLLNFWTKDLSLRDSVDRVYYTCRMTMIEKESVFCHLFQWMVDKKIFATESLKQGDASSRSENVNWNLEDFRKLASLIASTMVKGGTQMEDGQNR